MDILQPVDVEHLSALIEQSKASGGAETANTQKFIEHFCLAMGVPAPDFTKVDNSANDYAYERRITFKHPDGSTSPGRIDLYKRGCFILESKQSSIAQSRVPSEQLALLPEDATQRRQGTARRGTGGWDRAMLAARNQAESYARALPVEHGYPPFLLVLDVGHVLEVYADFSGQGKNYAHFPDRQSYRVSMDDLLRPDVQARVRAIWTEPLTLDPARRSAEVTRDIAGRLSIIAKRLELKHDAKDVAEFLMRCLFTMFAEDVGLLPEAGFADLLKTLSEHPETFPMALESLWKTMDEGGYEPRLMTVIKRFNGSLFKSRRALPLAAEDIHELYVAAKQDWSDVEPAIFGTLLERALDPRERSKLGAHYTPRAYVERLVIPTIIEPLRDDWEDVQAHVADLKREGKDAEAVKAVKDFHHVLCTTRVLDPACGTGNFLYVSLELMKRLEGEVLEALQDLGEDQHRLLMEGETVSPAQFYGLEINSRAVPIADLVLWIGFLKWQLRTVGLQQIAEPVLHAYGTIRHQDAILAFDRLELRRDENGNPVTRWDGVTTKTHPVTGEEVPDPAAQIDVYRYVNPRPSEWPQAEFIVGNPPFIGNKRMRDRLGWEYVSSLFDAYPDVPHSADFVMFWWEKAALAVQETRARRFGLVTTNSIRQTFNRRVVSKFLAGSAGLHFAFAIPDHPWTNSEDAAAVRISMTTCERGRREGLLSTVKSEVSADDGYDVEYDPKTGFISALLQIGADLTTAVPLLSNNNICVQGIKVVGDGFFVSDADVQREGWSTRRSVRSIASAQEMVGRGQGKRQIIDFSGLSLEEAKAINPFAYQRILTLVKPQRDLNARKSIRELWWRFAWERPVLRASIRDLRTYLVTPETSRHRLVFTLTSDTVCDGTLFSVGLEGEHFFAVLQSRIQALWTLTFGNQLGPTPRFNNTSCFDPFPFPELREDTATKSLLCKASRDLQAFRNERLAAHEFLTMTSLYNVLERLRELESGAEVEPLNDRERAIHEAGLVSVLKEMHDDLDRAVFAAYGWSDLVPALVGKPGATTLSSHKAFEQESAEEELLTRLAALNRERAAEEARGLVRWLRPDFQIPRLGHGVQVAGEQTEADLGVPLAAERLKWPADALEQIRIVRDVLVKAPAPLPVEGIAISFEGRATGKRRGRVKQVLDTLVATGAARTNEAGDAYFVSR